MGKFNTDKREGAIKHPFTVPDGYFDNFTDLLMTQLPEKEYSTAAKTIKKATLWNKVSPWFYMAAMVAAMALFFRIVTPSEDNPYAYVIGLDHSSIKKALSDISEDEFFEIVEDRACLASYYQAMLTDSNY